MSNRTQRRLAREATRERTRRLEAVKAAQYARQAEARPPVVGTLAVIAILVAALVAMASW
jgi:hypothetical protein